MAKSISNIGTNDPAQLSADILSGWVKRAGVERETILAEINLLDPEAGLISDKSFRQWSTTGNFARSISGYSPEIKGARVVSIVQWFLKEEQHRLRPIILSDEMRKIIGLYQDIPVKNRLQLKALMHDLEIRNHERSSDFSFAKNWRTHFSDWPAFCFVIDPYWCIRATTRYEMALAGYSEDDMRDWGWWHRLLGSKAGKPKYLASSSRHSLRGPYADTYYQMQLNQFWNESADLREKKDPRYQTLISLLESDERFREMEKQISSTSASNQNIFGLPIPFFRKDRTLLWMMELRTAIPQTPGYRLISWMPLNEDSAEYAGEIRRMADESRLFSSHAYFLEDFAQHFSPVQKFALGLSSTSAP
ncbi:MAG: hypothetical protein VB108_00340 [Anaerolineaceae bacterium]|nr:hypothetical protein [Anaerolineaceae bacterium]